MQLLQTLYTDCVVNDINVNNTNFVKELKFIVIFMVKNFRLIEWFKP